MLPCPDCRGTGRDPGKTVVGPKGRTSNYYLMMVVWMIVFWFAFVISGNNLGKSWGFVNAEGALAGWYSVLLLVVPIVLAIVFRHWITFLATAALIVFAIYMLVILLA
jgi:amino acid permease